MIASPVQVTYATYRAIDTPVQPLNGSPFCENESVPPSTAEDSVALKTTVAPTGAGFSDEVMVIVVVANSC